jgi:hypothetical protein
LTCLSLSSSLPGSAITVTTATAEQDVYRDFLLKLPTKDYRKNFGQEYYRFPKMKIGLLLHLTELSATTLKRIMHAVNFHRSDVDVVFFFQNGIVQDFNIEDCAQCHTLLVADESSWPGVEEEILARHYDLLVFLPSGEDAVDERVISKAIHRYRPGTARLAHQSLLLSTPTRQFMQQSDFERWRTLSEPFDYAMFWGSMSQYTSFRAKQETPLEPAPPPVSSCRVLVSQEEQSSLNTPLFLHKIFVLVGQLTRLSLSGQAGVGSVLNIDDAKLLKPSDVFMEQHFQVYIKASFGYVIIYSGEV